MHAHIHIQIHKWINNWVRDIIPDLLDVTAHGGYWTGFMEQTKVSEKQSRKDATLRSLVWGLCQNSFQIRQTQRTTSLNRRFTFMLYWQRKNTDICAVRADWMLWFYVINRLHFLHALSFCVKLYVKYQKTNGNICKI